LRELQGPEHKTAPGEDEVDLPARKSRTNCGPRIFGDPPFDKTQSGANGAARWSPSRWLDTEGKILLLDELEFSYRPDHAADRYDSKRHVIHPTRQQHRQTTQEVHSPLSLLLDLSFEPQ